MKLRRLSWREFDEGMDKLTGALRPKVLPDHHIVGHPRGGLIPAVALSHRLGLPMLALHDICYGLPLIWVDDVYETGATHAAAACLTRPVYLTSAVWISKALPVPGLIVAEYAPPDEWLVFPWEDADVAREDYHRYTTSRAQERP